MNKGSHLKKKSRVSNESGVLVGQGVRGSQNNKVPEVNKESRVSIYKGFQLKRESGVSIEEGVSAEQEVVGLY